PSLPASLPLTPSSPSYDHHAPHSFPTRRSSDLSRHTTIDFQLPRLPYQGYPTFAFLLPYLHLQGYPTFDFLLPRLDYQGYPTFACPYVCSPLPFSLRMPPSHPKIDSRAPFS